MRVRVTGDQRVVPGATRDGPHARDLPPCVRSQTPPKRGICNHLNFEELAHPPNGGMVYPNRPAGAGIVHRPGGVDQHYFSLVWVFVCLILN